MMTIPIWSKTSVWIVTNDLYKCAKPGRRAR